MEMIGDDFHFPLEFEVNDQVEDNAFSTCFENNETNNGDENISISSEPPVKKAKTVQKVLQERVRKYLGMKAHELRKILEQDTLKFCQQNNLLASSAVCSCGENMYLCKRKQVTDGFTWCCTKGHKQKNLVTIRKGSWFEKSKVPLSEVLWIMYMWVYEYSYISMVHESNVGKLTLQEWCCNCRDACLPILKTKTQPIGGSYKTIEIFEAKFKESQNSKMENDSDQWILFAIEQFSTKAIFLSVPDKKLDTLFDIFDDYILSGTIVHSRSWNIYVTLDKDGFDYLTKEKLITFHDYNSKTDMDTFEKFQKVAKRPSSGPRLWDEWEFSEHMYRKTLYFASDAYLAFLKDISLIYSPEGGVIRKDAPIPKTEKKS